MVFRTPCAKCRTKTLDAFYIGESFIDTLYDTHGATNGLSPFLEFDLAEGAMLHFASATVKINALTCEGHKLGSR